MKILHLFSGYNTFTDICAAHNVQVTSLNDRNYQRCTASTIICDFMDFKYLDHNAQEFDFVLVGFPCTTFSKASGNLHFKSGIPQSSQALKSIELLKKLQTVLQYFECDFMIENPTSALFSNPYFSQYFNINQLHFIRLHQHVFGHQAYKQTDLVTTKNGLILSNPVHRVNGNYSKKKFSNLTIKQRQSYPPAFCEALLKFILD